MYVKNLRSEGLFIKNVSLNLRSNIVQRMDRETYYGYLHAHWRLAQTKIVLFKQTQRRQEDIHGEADGLWDEYIIVIQTKKEKDGRRKKMAGFVGRTFAGSNVKSRAVDLKRKKNFSGIDNYLNYN